MFQFKSSCTVIYLLVVTKHVPEFQQNKGQNNCSLSHFLRFRKAEVMNNKKKYYLIVFFFTLIIIRLRIFQGIGLRYK